MSLGKDTSNDSAIERLREILFKKEASRISAIEEIHDNQALYAQDIAKVLAEAVRLSSEDGKSLGKALRPAIEDALNISISENPKPLSDALFPVMGPAIRKAIQHAIAGMLQSLNKSLEYAFSIKSLKWRLEALRTGKSFAEVLLLHTLEYRVEQIFWIHKESGLLLKHLSFDASLNEDADVVSSMLTAVRDFIQDSFAGDVEQEVQSMRLGELEILLEQGPDSVLAMVCRGNPPLVLREKMEVTLEHLQQEFHSVLNTFEGDIAPLESAYEYLSPLMLVDYVSEEKKQSPMKLLLGMGIVLLALLGYWGWAGVQDAQREARWHAYVDVLKAQDGIVVTDAKEEDGVYYITGLRDAFSVKPESLLKKFEFKKAQFHYQFQPYHALQAEFILKRIRQRLSPPSTVSMYVQSGVLYVSGEASHAWIETFHAMRYWFEGISSINDDKLDESNSLFDRVKEAIQPPDSIVLNLKDSQLYIEGLATEKWLKNAESVLKTMRGVAAYDDKGVEVVDSPAVILRMANEVLQPPKSVHLYVTGTKRIVAQGHASAQWIEQAKHRAKRVAFARDFDAKQLQVLLSDDDILQAAIMRLQPPETVKLIFSQGILHASGVASQAWIGQAKKNALLVNGVKKVDVSDVQASMSPWQKLKDSIDNMHLVSAANMPNLQAEDKKILQTLAAWYQEALSMDQSSVLVIHSVYGNGEKLVAKLRYQNVANILHAYGLKKHPIRLDFQANEQSTQASQMTFTLLSQTVKK